MSPLLRWYHAVLITIASSIAQLEIWDGATSSRLVVIVVMDHFGYLVLFVFLCETYLFSIPMKNCFNALSWCRLCGPCQGSAHCSLCDRFGQLSRWQKVGLEHRCAHSITLLVAAGFLTVAKLSMAYKAPNISCLWPFAEKICQPWSKSPGIIMKNNFNSSTQDP